MPLRGLAEVSAFVSPKFDPYNLSYLVEKIRRLRRMSVLDLDGTYAAGSIEARRQVRMILEKAGALIFSTARTPELVMSSHMHQRSRYAGGFWRPRPNWRWNESTQEYEYVALESLDEFACVIDPPDGIFAFGDRIYLRHPWCPVGGRDVFVADQDHEHKYLDPVYFTNPSTRKRWRAQVVELLRTIGADQYMASIDCATSYGAKKANVAALDYRIQLDIYGEGAVIKKYQILEDIYKAQKGTPLEGSVEGVDESNPRKNRATLYVMHPAARKEDMLNYALRKSCVQAGIEVAETEIFIAGDTLTDFYQMLDSAWDAKVTGLIVSDRLAECIQEKTNFAGVDMREVHNSLIPIPGLEGHYRYLNPHGRGGLVLQEEPLSHWRMPERRIILGHKAYPGTDGADTILACLQDRNVNVFGLAA